MNPRTERLHDEIFAQAKERAERMSKAEGEDLIRSLQASCAQWLSERMERQKEKIS